MVASHVAGQRIHIVVIRHPFQTLCFTNCQLSFELTYTCIGIIPEKQPTIMPDDY